MQVKKKIKGFVRRKYKNYIYESIIKIEDQSLQAVLPALLIGVDFIFVYTKTNVFYKILLY